MRCKVDKTPTTDSMTQNHVDIFENARFSEARRLIAIESDRLFHHSIKAVEKF
jgi:hypothetical protein